MATVARRLHVGPSQPLQQAAFSEDSQRGREHGLVQGAPVAWHGSESGRAGALVGMLAWQLKTRRAPGRTMARRYGIQLESNMAPGAS